MRHCGRRSEGRGGHCQGREAHKALEQQCSKGQGPACPSKHVRDITSQPDYVSATVDIPASDIGSHDCIAEIAGTAASKGPTNWHPPASLAAVG